MNERMREILDDAEVIWDKPDAYDPLALVSLKEFKEILELVIRECAEIADKAEPYKASDLIKKHFGVKE